MKNVLKRVAKEYQSNGLDIHHYLPLIAVPRLESGRVDQKKLANLMEAILPQILKQ